MTSCAITFRSRFGKTPTVPRVQTKRKYLSGLILRYAKMHSAQLDQLSVDMCPVGRNGAIVVRHC